MGIVAVGLVGVVVVSLVGVVSVGWVGPPWSRVVVVGVRMGGCGDGWL